MSVCNDAARALPNAIFMDLQSCSSVEVDKLGSIIFCFDQRNTEADLHRSKWRLPRNAYTGGGPKCEVVADALLRLDARIWAQKASLAIDLTKCSEVREQRSSDSVVGRQEVGYPKLNGFYF